MFNNVPRKTPLLQFYVHNYIFLCRRNAKKWEGLDFYFHHALLAAKKLRNRPALYNQLRGFIVYNMARHCIQNIKDKEKGFEYMVLAAQYRLEFYEAVKGSNDTALLTSAATQVWKIRHDWPALLGADTIDQCPVSQELCDQLVRDGLVDQTHAATKK
jgi:hypothetical protein